MTYTHLTKEELIWIEEFYNAGLKAYKIAKKIGRALQTVYNVTNFLEAGGTIMEFSNRYKENKSRCGAKKKELTKEQIEYVQEKTAQGWSPDVIIGRNEGILNCSVKTLYRRFKDTVGLSLDLLPMKGKRKKNNHQEKRGKINDCLTLEDRSEFYPKFDKEFGHLEGDTIIGQKHKSAVVTLVERTTKTTIPLKTEGRKAKDIESSINNFLDLFPRNFFQSITFDRGKEFANWKSIANRNDILIFFADPGCPGQRGLNENSNGLLRRDGLPKKMDFREVSQDYLSKVAFFRNSIPRKILDFYTPLEMFVSESIERISHLTSKPNDVTECCDLSRAAPLLLLTSHKF